MGGREPGRTLARMSSNLASVSFSSLVGFGGMLDTVENCEYVWKRVSVCGLVGQHVAHVVGAAVSLAVLARRKDRPRSDAEGREQWRAEIPGIPSCGPAVAAGPSLGCLWTLT